MDLGYLLWKFYIKSWPASQFPLYKLPNIQPRKQHSIAVLYLVFAILSLHSSERKSPLSSLKQDKEHRNTEELTGFPPAPFREGQTGWTSFPTPTWGQMKPFGNPEVKQRALTLLIPQIPEVSPSLLPPSAALLPGKNREGSLAAPWRSQKCWHSSQS